jgi:hypothetical protein
MVLYQIFVTGICVDRTFMMIVLAIIDCDGGSFKNLLWKCGCREDFEWALKFIGFIKKIEMWKAYTDENIDDECHLMTIAHMNFNQMSYKKTIIFGNKSTL